MKKTKVFFILIVVMLLYLKADIVKSNAIHAKRVNPKIVKNVKKLKPGKVKVFLTNGNEMIAKFIDFSSRTKKLEFANGKKIHFSRIWMINFINTNWYFINDKKKRVKNFDLIILKNGKFIIDKIIDFSSRRRVFEFNNSKDIHISKIKRIYFRNTKIPAKFKTHLKAF